VFENGTYARITRFWPCAPFGREIRYVDFTLARNIIPKAMTPVATSSLDSTSPHHRHWRLEAF